MTDVRSGPDMPSLPARPVRPLRRRMVAAVERVTTRLSGRALPVLPDAALRLLAGGRPTVIDGNTMDTALQVLLAGDRATGGHGLVVDHDAELTRVKAHDSCLALGGPIAPVTITDLSIPGPAGAIPARHYRPTEPGSASLLVYFHGGGFVFGDLDGFDPICSQFSHLAGVHVLSVDYRLAPEHKAPAAVDDAYAAFRWASAHAAELGADPDRVAVGGDSAGGMLAAVVSQLARDAGGPQPCLQLLNYPVIDFAAQTRSRTLFASGFLLTQDNMDYFRRQYLDGSGVDALDPRVSPLLAADLAGLPPAVVVTAGFDPLRDEGNHYAAALAAAGVEVDLREQPAMIHAFVNFNGLGGGTTRSVADIASALRAHLRQS
ncbi:MAG: alpha/beta hydrolase [Mycobacterium sp.]